MYDKEDRNNTGTIICIIIIMRSQTSNDLRPKIPYILNNEKSMQDGKKLIPINNEICVKDISYLLAYMETIISKSENGGIVTQFIFLDPIKQIL